MDALIGVYIFFVLLFLFGLGFVSGGMFYWKKLRFINPGKAFDMLKNKDHEKELKSILKNLNKLSIAEVEFILHIGVFGRAIKVIKSINRTQEVFDVVTFAEEDSDSYTNIKENLKDNITG